MKISLDKLSTKDTLFLKGLAICGMLMWHIFWCPNPQGIVYSPLVRYIGSIGDVCVSIFLFVSGYGLTIGYKKKGERNPIAFIGSRLIKFYSNFWFVFLFIYLYGRYVMNLPIYTDGSNLHKIYQYGKEFLAIRGQDSYNDSWWYFSLIISLYLIYPLLYWGVKKVPYIVIFLVLFLGNFSIRFIDQNLQLYLPIFIVGIYWAMYGRKIPSFEFSKIVFLVIITLSIPLIILMFIYNFNAICSIGIPLYAMLTISLTILTILFQNTSNLIKHIFCYLGTYSTNIYIIHLMFSKYWFSDTFYGLGSPWIIFIALLISSLIFSIAIEWIKEKSGYNMIFNKLLIRINNITL